jgi:hypothetical protein
MLALAFENGLRELQRSFAEAIFCHDAPIPATVRKASGNACVSRFGVYRNNVIASLIGAIGSRYPACRKLMWPDTFDGAAHLYVRSEPPRSPVLLHYGDSFPSFLRRIGDGAAADYVADIAELETGRVRAYHAADASSVSGDAFRRVPEQRLPGLRMRLHPSVSLVRSRFPIVSAWEAAIRDADGEDIAWRPEAALIARPDTDVEVRALPPGGFAFFTAIAEGQTVTEAAGLAARQDAAFDLAAALGTMISAGIVIGLDLLPRGPKTMSHKASCASVATRPSP